MRTVRPSGASWNDGGRRIGRARTNWRRLGAGTFSWLSYPGRPHGLASQLKSWRVCSYAPHEHLPPAPRTTRGRVHAAPEHVLDSRKPVPQAIPPSSSRRTSADRARHGAGACRATSGEQLPKEGVEPGRRTRRSRPAYSLMPGVIFRSTFLPLRSTTMLVS